MKYMAWMGGKAQWGRPLDETTAHELAARLARDNRGKVVELRTHPDNEVVCTWQLNKHNTRTVEP